MAKLEQKGSITIACILSKFVTAPLEPGSGFLNIEMQNVPILSQPPFQGRPPLRPFVLCDGVEMGIVQGTDFALVNQFWVRIDQGCRTGVERRRL